MLTSCRRVLQRRGRAAALSVAALAAMGLLPGCSGDPYAGLEPVFCYQTLADVA